MISLELERRSVIATRINTLRYKNKNRVNINSSVLISTVYCTMETNQGNSVRVLFYKKNMITNIEKKIWQGCTEPKKKRKKNIFHLYLFTKDCRKKDIKNIKLCI